MTLRREFVQSQFGTVTVCQMKAYLQSVRRDRSVLVSDSQKGERMEEEVFD